MTESIKTDRVPNSTAATSYVMTGIFHVVENLRFIEKRAVLAQTVSVRYEHLERMF